jgi:hypothetical protein
MEKLPDKDPELWEIANKRASFKTHVMVFAVVNLMLWVIWLFIRSPLPWPLFVSIGWGIGLAQHYQEAYQSEKSFAEKEYEKLLEEKEERNFFREKRYKDQ